MAESETRRMLRENIANFLRTKRLDSRQKLRHLAWQLDCELAQLSAWEHGRTMPSLEPLLRMVKVFRVPLSEIIGHPTDPDPVPDDDGEC